MNQQLVEFLAQYQVGASLRSQVGSSLSTVNLDLLPILLLLEEPQSPGGSHPGRGPNLRRDAPLGHAQLMKDYFAPDPVYGEGLFRRRFRMPRDLFVRIMTALGEDDVYFTQRSDALGKPGLSPHQKCTAAIRQLAYGTTADQNDEYLRIGESTAIECLLRFCNGVIRLFSPVYQRRPNAQDVQRIVAENAERGFPGMLGSLDCMHWQWKNCPKALQGHFSGRKGKPTLVLEAVATRDLWIWHSFFGMPGAMNDINVLERSSLFTKLSRGEAPPCDFVVNGHEYHTGYYLADGIYPNWSTLVKTFSAPSTPELSLFAQYQESVRKDVERSFGVLQARFHIVKGAARMWQPSSLALIMNTCIILHNMIIEAQGNVGLEYFEREELLPPPRLPRPNGLTERFMQGRSAYREADAHFALRDDLIQEIWNVYGPAEGVQRGRV